MEYTTLGETGIKVSVAGLGCGGFSKLGQGTGKTESESVNIVRKALDLGINFIDTVQIYGTETIIGKAIKGGNRDETIISTKKTGQRRRRADIVQRSDSIIRGFAKETWNRFDHPCPIYLGQPAWHVGERINFKKRRTP